MMNTHKQRKLLCGNRNYTTQEDRKNLPPSITNDETSQLEYYEWVNDPPKDYFAYVFEEERTVTYAQTHTFKVPVAIGTWTGEKLGTITSYSHKWMSNFGDYRISIRVTGTNGKYYYGTYFCSAGAYCRLKECKSGLLTGICTLSTYRVQSGSNKSI